MTIRALVIFLLCPTLFCHTVFAQETLESRTQRYLIDLIRFDTSNPPGNETIVAEYINRELTKEGLPCEILGEDPARKNVVCRLKGGANKRPLLLMAHSDVVPVDPKLWTVPAFEGIVEGGFIYGRGAVDTKGLLAAEMAVLVELKRIGARLNRDLILLSEADEEAGSTGIQWLIRNAWDKIDAEFALNEGGGQRMTTDKVRVFQVQTSEKIPTRVILVAKGTAGHGSLPRKDNAVAHLAQAIANLVNADQPVRLNTTTRRYFRELANLDEYAWLRPLLGKLEDASTTPEAANQIGERDDELGASLRTTISPTMLRAGMKVNVIPNEAEAQIDIRRLPNETKEEVYKRLRTIINDPLVDIHPEPGQQMPATEPSSLTTDLYKAMERVFTAVDGKKLVVPFMARGATDGAFLRAKGMAVYGVPVFLRPGNEARAHGNDERISVTALAEGVGLLEKIVAEVAVIK
ncbi:MAG TPA: M20/M25/M40 family metallo-hydrolase [Bryobacteraceae bacterium]|nr:M20/M25/M40 family metallo-hydrolase [Bryobacteraceae bacterium]